MYRRTVARATRLSAFALFGMLAMASACDCEGKRTGAAATGVALVTPEGAPDEFERTLDFGSVRVATLATRPITLRNVGRATARVTNATMTTESPDFFLKGSTERPTLEPGEEWTLELRYMPNEIGADTATVVIETDIPDTAKYTLHVTGRGAASMLEACTTGDAGGEICASQMEDGLLVIDLGEVAPGQKRTRPLVVRNKGDATLTATRIGMTSTTTRELSLTPETTTFTVAPQDSKSFEVVYAPVDGGDDEGAIEILSDDPQKPRTLVFLRAAGLAPRLCVEPLEVRFGETDVGTTKTLPLALVSCGREPVTVKNLAVFAGEPREVFALDALPAVPLTLAVGERLELQTTYAPTAFAEDSGRVTIVTDAAGSARGSVPLTGRGVGCTLSIAPSPVAFGAASTNGMKSKTLQVRNTGTGACVVTNIDGPDAPFSVEALPELPFTITPGQFERLVVNFAPTSNGSASSELVFQSNNRQGDVVVVLTGNGIDPPPCDLQALPSSLVFAGVSTGDTATMNILLKNYGTDSCYVAKAETVQGSSPAFSAVFGGTGFQQVEVKQGGQLSVPIKFSPTTAGVHTGTMRFTYSDDDFPNIGLPGFPGFPGGSSETLDVPLEGGTLEPSVCIDPPELDFGQVATRTTKELTFAIRSCGQGALQVRGLVPATGSSTEYALPARPGLPTFLAAGQSLSVRVAFSPRTGAPAFGSIAVLTNDPNTPEASVRLRGNGAVACGDKQLACTTTELAFPTLEIGRGSSLSVSCRNIGQASVRVAALRFAPGTSAEFKTNTGPLPEDVAPGGVLRFEVSYLPQDAGNDAGSVTVESDSCDAPHIALTGAGKQPNYPTCPKEQVFQPVEKWAWSGGTTNPQSRNVAMSPLVINLTDDNGDGRIDEDDIPDVIFTSCKSGECCIKCMNPQDMKNADLSGKGMLRAVHGKTGRELWSVTDPGLALTAMTQVAAGDINGDNLPEIIAVKHHFQPGQGDFGMEGKYMRGTLLVFNHKGELMFETEEWTGEYETTEQSGAPTLGDLDGDGQVEIIFERTVFSSTGRKLFDLASTGNTGHGSFALIVDVDGDGSPEIINGHKAYRADGTLMWTAEGASAGQNMVVDVDGDGLPELVLRDRADRMGVYDGRTGKRKYGPWSWELPKNSEGQTEGICPAPMAAADLDGDGLPDLIVPSGDYLYAFKGTGQQMWRMPIDDYGGQCGASGAAAFDFEGDGKYEVVYHDTAHMYVFRGTTGQKIYDAPRNSSTIWETPVVADVDNDGHADLVMTNENGLMDLGQTGAGVKVLSNVGNNWPATRRIWNQHSYHVSDVNENGTIPRVETPHYTTTNSWRANHSKCVPGAQ